MDGIVPATVEDLMSVPGIGRSFPNLQLKLYYIKLLIRYSFLYPELRIIDIILHDRNYSL
jgi:hypothetical protein